MTSSAFPKLYFGPRYSTVGAISGEELMRKLTVKKMCVLVITVTDRVRTILASSI